MTKERTESLRFSGRCAADRAGRRAARVGTLRPAGRACKRTRSHAILPAIMAKESFATLLEQFHKSKQLILDEIAQHVVGQHAVIEQMLAAILTRGHCLLVGVPGLAKTLMVSTLARCTSLEFKRIQFTPDLMPSDITGTNVIDEL